MRKAITSREPVKIQATDDTMLAEWCNASQNRGYGDKCKQAIIFTASSTAFYGVKALVVIGIAPRRPYDEAYQAWMREVQKQIAESTFAITCIEAREAEKRKASDRAREEAELNSKKLQLRQREVIIAKEKTKTVLAMAETIDVGFFDYLPTGELIQANNAFYQLSGYPKDPALNKQYTFLDYCMPDDVDTVMEKWTGLMSGVPCTFEMRWKNNTPSGQWVLAACTPVFDEEGNIVSISGCTTDLSKQKLAQENALKRAEALEQVRISQARLLQFTNIAPIGIMIRGYPNDDLYFNNCWYEMTGHPRRAFSDVDPASVYYPDDLWIPRAKIAECLEYKKSVEFRARLRKTWTSVDGSFQGQAWVSVICFPEYSEDGTLVKAMSTWTDISHLQFEEHLQQKRLEAAIEAKRSAEAFIDITSHEIRNPLGATMHCADMLRESLVEMGQLINTLAEGNLDEETRQNTKGRLEEHLKSGTETVDTILSCSMHQKRVTDDILSLSKLDSNLVRVTPTTVRATEILDTNIFSAEADRMGVQLQTELDTSLSELDIDWVLADSGRISQVLVNLVTNAIKFTKTSQSERTVVVRLGASKERPSNLSVTYATMNTSDARVQTELTNDGTIYLWFSVTDSGCGMSEEEQKRMFNRFSQASPKTYTQYGGSGLGLFISKRLVELQGGQIGLSSVVDVGSRFAFYVPATRATEPSDPPKPDLAIHTRSQTLTSAPVQVNGIDASQPSSTLSILVVEDNLVNQKVLQKHLTKLGHKVQVANHGQEALDFLATTSAWKHANQNSTSTLQDVDVVLMDIEMPVMNGLICSRRIRDMQASGELVRHVPIIAVSANARTEQTKQAHDAGVDDFIVKPFRIPELISVISRLVEVA
ncbi:unnamed protein product [Aureobasidium uvarum]|uniref:histidine kinase n=1 Tax=Aureobasidium uvarum TaxID=2773716 RepID=A0A9N8KB30_9PEZI|nr:unnamed protein product [Aureobasidium uvarum]